MSYVLTPNENLEEKRLKLSRIINRPVYVVNKFLISYDKDVWLKSPGEFNYKHSSEFSRLGLTLSTLTDNGTCVKVEGEGKDRKRYFNLEYAKTIYLVFPLKLKEIKNDFKSDDPKSIRNAYRNINLYCDFGYSTFFLSKNDIVPKELEEFVEESRDHYSKALQKAIKFYYSEPIENPLINKDKWHLDDFSKFSTLRPPGQYNGDKYPVLTQNNRMCITKAEIGSCIICHGDSKEEWHIAPLFTGEPPYPLGHICRKCSKQTFEAWQKILDEQK